MKRKLKLLLSVALALSVITTVSYHKVSAATNSNLSNIEMIGKNAVKYMTKTKGTEWDDIKIINDRELYDFDGKLIGHSLDLKNNKTDEKAYVILSDNVEDELVSEFAIGHYSPYTERQITNNDVCIYDGAISYYSKNSIKSNNKTIDKYIDINTKIELKDDQISSLVNNAKNKKYKSLQIEKAKIVRSKLSSNSDMSNLIISPESVNLASSTSKILSNVGDYKWKDGCSPTSAAMIIYPRIPYTGTSDDYIHTLALAMHTNLDPPSKDGDGGCTSIDNIPIGINNTTRAFHATNDAYFYSTFAKYCAEIDAAYPVLVTVNGNTKYGVHTMAGLGYQSDSSGNFVIVHDTTCSGNVYLNYDSSSFGTPLWTYIHFNFK